MMKNLKRGSLLVVVLLVAAFAVPAMAATTAGKAAPESAKSAASVKSVPIVNAKCPIMGTQMDKTAPEDMTRLYKDQRIGFCCGGCLKKWDAMSNAEKDRALKKAMGPMKD